MKKIMIETVLGVMALVMLAACSEADRVSHNLSEEAEDFNVVRKLTVINAIQGEVLFEMTGKMSIEVDETNQLEIVTVDKGKDYKKHFVGLSDNVTYVVEDVTGSNVEDDHYVIKFNPKSVLPLVELED